ncbi:hypothetical protein CHS0354_025511 [Potamilus streckersoni]|uniref:Uncharacterized protein n=1 Tax=Potamilus streckersoni TaxID=2493646 RepID=A0AAE0SKL4_9BIVA|nr:hypothetical protein CHS0354_025511 [Potamilus streckersoni]
MIFLVNNTDFFPSGSATSNAKLQCMLNTTASACGVVDDAELNIQSHQAQPQEKTGQVATRSIAIRIELLKSTENSDSETETSSEDDIDPDIYDSEYELHSDADDDEDSDDNGDFEDMHMKDAKTEDHKQFLVS